MFDRDRANPNFERDGGVALLSLGMNGELYELKLRSSYYYSAPPDGFPGVSPIAGQDETDSGMGCCVSA